MVYKVENMFRENIIIAILAMLCNHRLDLTFRLNEKSLVLDITF